MCPFVRRVSHVTLSTFHTHYGCTDGPADSHMFGDPLDRRCTDLVVQRPVPNYLHGGYTKLQGIGEVSTDKTS